MGAWYSVGTTSALKTALPQPPGLTLMRRSKKVAALCTLGSGSEQILNSASKLCPKTSMNCPRRLLACTGRSREGTFCLDTPQSLVCGQASVSCGRKGRAGQDSTGLAIDPPPPHHVVQRLGRVVPHAAVSVSKAVQDGRHNFGQHAGHGRRRGRGRQPHRRGRQSQQPALARVGLRAAGGSK